jgi:hypothetical protein
MGAGQSIPATLTRQKVFELTRDTRGLMSVLLEYMLKEVTVRDFMALSNPTECRKYVIFMANALHKSFYELQIVPTRDKRGVIAFRPIKELIQPPSEEGDKERQSLCLTLAYFYTRIFQIYGALALTLIDDASVISESGLTSFYGEASKTGLVAPGRRPYVSAGGAAEIMIGGVPPRGEWESHFNYLKNFYFLVSYLNLDEPEPSIGYPTLYDGSGEGKADIYFNTRSSTRREEDTGRLIDPDAITTIQNGKFIIVHSGRIVGFIDTAANYGRIGSGEIVCKFRGITYYKKNSREPISANIPRELMPQQTLTILSRQDPLSKRKIYFVKSGEGEEPVAEYFNNLLEKFVLYIKQLAESGYSTPTATTGNTYATTSSTTIRSEVGTAEELHLARLLDNLQKTKPLGHCLARAMQLLKTLPMGGQPGQSDICKARFLEQTTMSSSGIKTIASRSGIPGPGDSLDKSPGMAATAQLFYDTIIIGTPKIIMGQQPKAPGQKSSVQQYIDFMRRMSVLFGDFGPDGKVKPNEVLQREGLKGIKNRRDRDMCGDKLDKTVIVPPNAVKSVYDVVNQLYRTQLEHSTHCGQIFKMLFAIEREKATGRYRISLSNNIIQKGFPEIEKINYIARDVLVKYYEKCEQTYLTGMARVINANKAAVAAARPGIPSVSGPAGRVPSAPVVPGAPLRAPGLPAAIAARPPEIPITAAAAAAAGRK